MRKRLFCCLLAALLVICLPVQHAAAEETDAVAFSTFEELRSFCEEDADLSGSALSCEAADLVISEDLELPSGRTFLFRSFTVPAGVTLTVAQGAELKAYGFTVQGRLINRGTVFQGDLSETGDVQDTEIAAYIPGFVENKGEMTLTDVYGKRNIRWLGSKLTMLETENYNKRFKTEPETPEPAASPTPEVTPPPAPPGGESGPISAILDTVKELLPMFAFILAASVFGRILKAAAGKKKQVKEPGSSRQRNTEMPRDAQSEDHFQRDRRNRISQLDDWLKSGLIDRDEYKNLKRRYERDE
ncbi:MAG: hypothetical protein IJH70_15155 [Oscillospiraceae bacterium]|nr:hypothetical protein [Oscillospiraceae bacterium]